MSARLSTAIRIGDAANAILQSAKSLSKEPLWLQGDHEEHSHIGVEPMLLALSMELALKAWYAFDYDTAEPKRSHDLLRLYSALLPESRDKPETAFKTTVAPHHPSFHLSDHGVEDVLRQHANAFVDWRYLHEINTTMMFDISLFAATLEMVIREFRKRYRIEKVAPLPPFGPT